MANDSTPTTIDPGEIAADLSELARKYGSVALIEALRDACDAARDHLIAIAETDVATSRGDAFAEASGCLAQASRHVATAEASAGITLADALEVLGQV